MLNYSFTTKAPADVEIVKVSATVVTVKATPPAGNPAIEEYEATVVGVTPVKKCKVMASVSPLQCDLTGLDPNTQYSISMKACLPVSAGCGAGVTKPTKTLPNRTLNH